MAISSRLLFCFFGIFCGIPAHSAANGPSFQQKVNYRIQSTLDDKNHRLECFWEMEYQNNSPDTLRQIYIHLWPNAYKNQKTAFAHQKLLNKSTDFYYSVKSERGFIEGLDFKADGVSLQTSYSENDEIAEIVLPRPLLPGQTIKISSSYRLKIPKSFSRLGHVGTSYQLTQWYPKPAVYAPDPLNKNNKWYTMPYLDQGEFFSEFGNYDVKISLPKNYRVGATGLLQNPEEKIWMDSIATATAALSDFGKSVKMPPSDKDFKTLHYLANNVHDFAIFADKRFFILRDKAKLPDGKQIDTWALFTNEEADMWKNAARYTAQAIEFYSTKVGAYAYPQATAVQSALSAGAGMEYPMITVIGLSRNESTLERVIVHEVGHNWFYGMLASNERDYPWMDEGINTYYENRYFEEKTDNNEVKPGPMNLGPLTNFLLGKKNERLKLAEQAYLLQARKNKDQPCGLKATEFSNTNYGIITYMKTGMAMEYLAAYLGQKKMDEIMQTYFQKYAFHHPFPQDIRNVFEEESGMELGWFFDDLINTDKKTDYILWKVNKRAKKIGDKEFDLLTAINFQENIAGPFSISAIKNGKEVSRIWYEGFHGIDTLLFPAAEADLYRIDAAHQLIEYNRSNNSYHTSGLFKKMEPLKFKFLGGVENPYRTTVFFLPILGYNEYDRWMPGISFYNPLLPVKKMDYLLCPLFSTRDKSLVGSGHIGYSIYPDVQNVERLRFYVQAQRFHHGLVTDRINDTLSRTIISEDPYGYTRLCTGSSVSFKKNMQSSVSSKLSARHLHILKDKYSPSPDPVAVIRYISGSPIKDSYFVDQLRYEWANDRAIYPYKFFIEAEFQQHKDAELQQTSRYLKLSGAASIFMQYRRSKRGIRARLFAGGFPYNATLGLKDYSFRLKPSGARGENDYVFDHLMMGRLEFDGWLSQQVSLDGGALHTRTDKISNDMGATFKYMYAVNLSFDFPDKIPIIPIKKLPIMGYINMAKSAEYEFVERSPSQTKTHLFDLVEMGLGVKFMHEAVEVYFPILYNKRLKDAVNSTTANYGQKITFLLDLDKLNLIKKVRNGSF